VITTTHVGTHCRKKEEGSAENGKQIKFEIHCHLTWDSPLRMHDTNRFLSYGGLPKGELTAPISDIVMLQCILFVSGTDDHTLRVQTELGETQRDTKKVAMCTF